MRRMIVCILLIALFAAKLAYAAPHAGDPAAAPLPEIRLVQDGGEPSFDLFDRYKGLASDRALKLLADRYGFVWIGGNNGLHRFDGHNFHTLDRNPDLPDSLASRIALLLADTSDALWIGNQDGVLQRLDRVTGRLGRFPIRTVSGESPQTIYWMGSDGNDTLWLHTDLGLLWVEPSRQAASVVMQPSEIEPDLAAFEFDLERKILLVTVDATVMAVPVDAPQRGPTKVLSIPDRQRITAMASGETGLWLVAGTQLWHWTSNGASLRRIATPVPMLRATSMVVDRQGVLWLASAIDAAGLYRLDPERGELSIYRHHDTDPQSLRHDRIWSLALDGNNDLWIGTRGGVNRLRLRDSGLTRIGLPGNRSAAICALHEGPARKLLVSICDEELREFDPATGTWRAVPADLASLLSTSYPGIATTISGMTDDGEGGVWIAGGAGLVHWRSNAPPQRIPFGTKPAVYMTAALLDGERRLWVVTHSNGLAVLPPGGQELQSVAIGSKGILTDIAAGPDGTLWLGSEHGLIHYSPKSGQARRFAHDPDDLRSLSDDHILDIHSDAAGQLWVGTRAGLNRLIVAADGGVRFRRYGIADGLPDQTIEAILSDAAGNLWVGTDRGVARWQPQSDRFQGYTSADGIPDDTIRKGGAVLSHDGSFYIGTSRSLWRLEPSKLQLSEPAPVAISGYEKGNTTVINHLGRELGAIEARHSDGRIAFRLASFGEPRRLSYRLVGLEDQWRDMPADLLIAYHRLQPARYRLQVRQLDGQGRWITGLELPVEITPPIWRTWWAYLAYATAITLWIAWLARSHVARRRRRREYVRTLRERDERLRLSMSASGGEMIEIDFRTGRVSQMGESGFDGSPEGRVVGIPDHLALVHPDDADSVAQCFEALQQQRTRDLDIEYRRRSSDGNWAWVRMRGQFIERLLEHRRDEVFTGMIHDISQERSYRELRQRGEFLAVVSHEIRTPLNGVAGMIELLDRTSLSDEQRKMLDACKESTSILLSLINDFLDLSKIDAGRLELEQAPLSPRDLVETAACSLSAQAGKQQLNLDIHVAADVPATIMGDWVRLRQILANLIGNAIKFTEQGDIKVILSMDAPELLRLTVTDTGIGMDEEVVRSLFQPFQQASAATARRFGGTGLGLSIVKSLAEAMGGRVECESRVGDGTRFSVIVPAPPVAAAHAENDLLKGVKYLVIAEDPDARKFIHEALRWLGAETEFLSIEAATGRIQTPGSPSVDAILIDKREPVEAHVASLRGEVATSATPIVAIGRDADPRPVAAGVVWVDGNPLTRSALVGGTELALGRAAAPSPLAEQEQQRETGASRAEVEARHGEVILLAEDNPINREVVTRQLAQLGHVCETATDGEEAWSMLQRHAGRYALLITDGQMPRLDGYRLTERIRRREAETGGPRLKILMVTAGTLAAERERCLALGMDGFLTKPLPVDALREKLSELLTVPVAPEEEHRRARSENDFPADFSLLMDLVRGNQEIFVRLLDLFVQTTRADWSSLERAMLDGNHRRASGLAHRMKSACFQLGQETAGHAFDRLERAALAHPADDPLLDRLMETAQHELLRAQALAEGYLQGR
jgi:PAS domain S-box-containing protein